MGLLENIQAQLKRVSTELAELRQELDTMKQKRTRGDKRALAAYLGASLSFVQKRTDLPRTKVGNKYIYDFAEVDAYLKKSRLIEERIKGDWV